MSTFNKISTRISEQLPDFVLEEGPKLEAFLRAYYEWMELSGNAIDGSKNLLSYQDIDNTLDDYLQYFREEIYKSIPDNIAIDKRLLAKHIRELYQSKGTEKSYKFLFRALFDEDIDIYFPSEYILRTSDGRWQQDTVIRVVDFSLEDSEDVLGRIVTGTISGAYGRVESSIQISELGNIVTELALSNIVGTFEDGETVTSTPSGITGSIYSLSGSLQGLTVQPLTIALPRGYGAGVFHRAGDLVSFTSDAGSGANGTISTTNDRSAINVGITSGGTGYVNNLPIVLTGGSGTGAIARVTGITDNTVIALCQDIILPMANVVLGQGPLFVSAGANSTAVSANLAGANIYSSIISSVLFSNTTVGTISQITMLNYGTGYSLLPVASVTNANVANEFIPDGNGGFLGKNADIFAFNLPGAISTVSLNSRGTNYSKFENIGIVNVSRAGTINAIATPTVSGIEVKPGRYISTKGFISWDQKLQDGDFYQEYSYVIRSSQFVDTYRKVIKEVLHPGGTKLFGETLLLSQFSVRPETDIVFDVTLFIDINVGEANSANVYAMIDPPSNRGVGNLFIFNYTTLAPFLANTVGFDTPTILSNFGEIALGDLNSAKLVFGNNTSFNSNNATLNGYIRQLSVSSNTLVGNGGTSFNTVLVPGDILYSTNSVGGISQYVRVVSVGGASSIVTTPSINSTVDFFQLASNTSSGATLKFGPPVLDNYDLIIFDTVGGTPDGQYAVNVVSSVVNNMLTLTSNYAGPTLANGTFSYVVN